MRQYPYALFVLQATPLVQNQYGEYVDTVADTWESVGPCRDEVNNGGSLVTLEDGSNYQYQTLIQLPTSALMPYAGTEIQVREPDGTVRVTGTVIRSVSNQLHKRIWV